MPEGTILDTILDHKRGEVAARQAATPLADLKARAADAPLCRGFAAAIRNPVPPLLGARGNAPGAMPAALGGHAATVALIAEVKKASPSAGIIRADFDPVVIAKTYEQSGASCLSVLTDERFFQGHDSYLKAVRQSVAIPLLRKDFTVDPYQIYEARVLGADALLLIVAALSADEIQEFQAIGHDLGLDVLVEVHTEEEMAVAVEAKATLVGINTRDLKRFVTDLGTFDRLAPMAPTGATLVAESGIKTPADVTRVAAAGANAILVGESLMRQPDIAVAVRELLG